MAKINTLKKAYEVLLKLGFEAILNEHSVGVNVGGAEHPFTAVITHNVSTEHFQITCLITRLNKIKKDTMFHFMLAALDANCRIMPFAYGLLTEPLDPKDEDDGKDWPVVLTHAVPLGDFSDKELESCMHSLVAALIDSENVIAVLSE